MQTVEDLDSSSLVHVCRLYQPIVLSAMLLWRPLFKTIALIFLKVNVAGDKLMKLVGVQLRGDNE